MRVHEFGQEPDSLVEAAYQVCAIGIELAKPDRRLTAQPCGWEGKEKVRLRNTKVGKQEDGTVAQGKESALVKVRVTNLAHCERVG